MIDRSMCSSWYFLRYTSPFEENEPFNPEKLNYWMPVDQYIIIIPINEPFKNLLNQGMVCKNGKPMSKLLGNTVSADEIIQKYGADTLRIFIVKDTKIKRKGSRFWIKCMKHCIQ